MRKLEQGVSERINSICDHAKRLVDGGDIKFAVTKYVEALNLIPNPKMDYKAATFIYTNVGEVYFRSGEFKKAGTAFSQASVCPGGSDNPIIIMRIGQCLLECGDKGRAEDYLYKAYLKGNEEIFAGEDEKYFALIRRRLNNASNSIEDDLFAADDVDDYIVEQPEEDENYITLPVDDYEPDLPEPEPEPFEPEEPRRRFSPKSGWDSDWDDEPEDNFEDDRIKSSYADDLDDDDDEDYDEGGLFSPLVNTVKSWFKK